MTIPALTCGVFALALSACVASPVDDTSIAVEGTTRNESGAWIRGAWTLTKTCVRWLDSPGHDLCETARDACFTNCLESCVYSGRTSCGFCSDLCGDCWQEPDSSLCDFRFTNTTEDNVELRTSCEAMWTTVLTCADQPVPNAVCDGFARAEREDMRPIYDCIATAACDDDITHCGWSRRVPDNVQPLLDRFIESPLPTIHDRVAELLRIQLATASDGALAALQLCDAQTDDSEFASCVRDWLFEVYGEALGSDAGLGAR